MTEIIGGITMHKGIDTSKYNEVIDWPEFKAQGIEYAIIRSGQGPLYKDNLFATHRDNAIKNGMPWSPYHFYDYRWPEGKAQFDNMKAIVGSNFGNLPSCIDLETLYSFTATKSTAIALPARNMIYTELMEFGTLLKTASGRKPMLYVGNLLAWLKPDQAFMDLFDLWFANWNPYEHIGSCAPWKNWLCWQRLGDVKLSGQAGVWDINYVKDVDWKYFVVQSAPVIPEYTDAEKLQLLWDDHPLLHNKA
jgi:GH25 family lysozyme M1 (1,4-beta-N-acetylmuramidase)